MSTNSATLSWSEPRTKTTSPKPWGWKLIVLALIAVATVIVGLVLATASKTIESAELGTVTLETTPSATWCHFKITLTPKLGSPFSAEGFVKTSCGSPETAKTALSHLLDQLNKLVEEGKRSPDWWLFDSKLVKWIKELWDVAGTLLP